MNDIVSIDQKSLWCLAMRSSSEEEAGLMAPIMMGSSSEEEAGPMAPTVMMPVSVIQQLFIPACSALFKRVHSFS